VESTSKYETQKNDPRDVMSEQMCEFACNTTEDRLMGELINNAVEEHLLVEFAFEAILKSLLREPSK
jgi:hypothetical protein